MLPPRPANTALGAPCAASTGRNRETPPAHQRRFSCLGAQALFQANRPAYSSPHPAGFSALPSTACSLHMVPNCVHRGAGSPPPGPDHRPSSASPTCVWCIIILASSSRLYHHITCPPLSLAQRPRFPPFLINPVEILLIPTWFFRSGPLPCLGVRLFCAQCMRLVESHSRWPCNSFNPHPAYP